MFDPREISERGVHKPLVSLKVVVSVTRLTFTECLMTSCIRKAQIKIHFLIHDTFKESMYAYQQWQHSESSC